MSRLSDIDPTTYVPIHSVELEMVQLAFTKYLSEQMLENTDFRLELHEDMGRMLAYELRAFLMGKTLHEESVTFPATWWDAFKERWFAVPYSPIGQRIVKRWPVRYNVKRWQLTALIPEVPVVPGKRQYLVQDDRAYSYMTGREPWHVAREPWVAQREELMHRLVQEKRERQTRKDTAYGR